MHSGTKLLPLLLLACIGRVAAEAPPAPPQPSVQSLAWLAGCWASVDGEAGSGETWTAPAGGTLLGIGRTVKGGRTVAHEFLQIRENQPGQITLTALPSGQKEASFQLLRLTEREVVFENPQHDFPQRVLYRLTGRDQLLGRIEGRRDGEVRGVDFPLKRVDCETLAAP
ncbi:MAG TPA: DUF6265 family protein [Thermoanaerobaculia bacterium]|nr:DUF6265 family protein [Thermoanaerobaculia bacterium]